MTVTTTSTVTGGQLVVSTLRALGVRFVFGVPGGQTLAITDALLDADGIQFVTARHEGAAACMADAIGRVTGRPGVCLATTGPGATNLLTGIGGAYRDSSPVIAVTCNNNLRDLDRDDAQAANHVSIFRSLTKWATLVTDTSRVSDVLEEAFLRATTGTPGPVLVDFARNVLEGSIPASHTPPDQRPAILTVPEQRPLGDPGLVSEAAELLVRAKAPVVWIGNGVQLSHASEAVLDLASFLSLPIITTFNAIGTVPSMHPNVFGPRSRMGTEVSSRVLTGADLLLVIGNSLNAISTARWTETLPDAIVQVDISPAMLGRYYPQRTVGIQGDARAVVQQVEEAVRRSSLPEDAQVARRNRLDELRAAKRAWWQDALSAESGDTGINPAALVKVVRDVSPDDTILVVDAGNPGVWTHLWEVRQPGTYLKPVGFGNMGFALPAAIATKLERPDTPVVALIGDGSLGMTLIELETMAREGTAACVVVMNDAGYGNIRQEEIVKYGPDRIIGVDFSEVDYAGVARACGINAVRVTTEQALGDAVRRALASGEPWLIDAPIDPNVNAWTYPALRPHEPEE